MLRKCITITITTIEKLKREKKQINTSGLFIVFLEYY
jgi:hypothetical protein